MIFLLFKKILEAVDGPTEIHRTGKLTFRFLSQSFSWDLLSYFMIQRSDPNAAPSTAGCFSNAAAPKNVKATCGGLRGIIDQ